MAGKKYEVTVVGLNINETKVFNEHATIKVKGEGDPVYQLTFTDQGMDLWIIEGVEDARRKVDLSWEQVFDRLQR